MSAIVGVSLGPAGRIVTPMFVERLSALLDRSAEQSTAHRSVGREILPGPLDQGGIHYAGIGLVRFLVRIQHELDRSALRRERAWVERVEAFVDRLGLGDTLLELERVDGRHLGV